VKKIFHVVLRAGVGRVCFCVGAEIDAAVVVCCEW